MDADTTEPLTIDRTTAWVLFDLVQMHLAGVSHRDETASPWHLEAVIRKLSYALTRLESVHPVATVDLDLTAGETEALILNVPRAAWEGARALLLDLFRLAATFQFQIPILADDPPEPPGTAARLAALRGYGFDSVIERG